MEAAQLAVRIAELVIFGALAFISVRRWRQSRDDAAKWWAVTVGTLGVVVAAGFLVPTDSESDITSWARKALVALLVLFPYAMFRYGGAFVRSNARLRRGAEALIAVMVVWTMFLPRLGGEGSPRSTALNIFAAALLVEWTALSSITVVRLWRVGNRQASVAKHRMRTMATGAALLNVALAIAVFAPSEHESWWPIVTGIIAIACALAFFVGFMPPKSLRMIWRMSDVGRLREAEIGLMTVVEPAEIGNALLPHATALFGAQGAALVDPAGDVIVESGLTAAEARAAAALALRAGDGASIQQGLMSVKMRNGWLVVRGNSVSPFFGRDELDVLSGLGLFADLALDRAALFESEREARQDAERANAELETFVYSVSHDLKSPLVSLLGFLDYLAAEIEGSLSEEGTFFLQRISAASLYMQALIQDLLELSRIGRVQTEPSDVALADILHEIVEDQRLGSSGASIRVGPLPVLSMNPLRARQLFTNLVNNALTHSGRADVTVAIDAIDAPDGGVVVSVADNGKGIPASYRDKVFGVFERLERQGAGESTSGGTGIGLAVCRKIVEQCGGQIDVGDNQPGARFSIRFPADAVRRGAVNVEVAS